MNVSANGAATVHDSAADHNRQRLADGAACLDAALEYLRAGWPVLALCPPDHAGVGKAHGKSCSSPGKAPWGPWKEFQTRLPTEEEVRRKFHDNPTLNVGVALGPLGGLVRIDVDGPGGERLLAEWSAGDLPLTLEFTSGRANGGRGLLYAIPPGVAFKTTFEQPDRKEELRFQALGAQTVLPPSRHPDGNLYAWLPGRGPGEAPAAPAPAWVVARWSAATAGARAARTTTTADGGRFAEGGRNSQLTSLAGTMRRRGFSRESIEAALLQENATRCDPPLDDDEVRIIAEHVAQYAPHKGNGHAENAQGAAGGVLQGAHLSDLGNARRVVERHGKDLRYVHPWKSWYVWDGCRWAEDTTAEAVRRVKDTQGALYRWAAAKIQKLGDIADDEERKRQLAALNAMLKHALKWEDARDITRSLELAKSESGIPILPADMDRDGWALNCLNGTLDLRTGELRPHRREDLITKLAPVAFDPRAKCPLWLGFLDRIMAGNRDLMTYLQRVVGYGLTGDVSEQCLWFFHGAGSNGKSTFLMAVLGMLGDYGMQAVSDLLMVKHNESHPTERADLFGKRFVATIETEEGKRIAEALMKQVTGGDKVRARKMRQDFFEFSPTHKIILAANHRPTIRGTDHAAWRRVKLVPFAVTIQDGEKDAALPEKLKAELPGILAWAVRGCLDWRREGLAEPDEVRQATTEYQAEQDTVQGFIGECCHLHPEARANSSGLLAAYIEWSGDKVMTAPAFRKRMKDKGFQSKEGTGGRWFWHGLALKQSTNEGAGSGGEWG